MGKTFIWGEMIPLSIPRFEDESIVLLGPMAMKFRTWDANLVASLHDAHEPEVWLRHNLTKGEVASYLDRFAQLSPHSE